MRHLFRDCRGATIVEFAMVLPLLITLMYGMLAYGQYFLLAHSTQQLANDAARATVAGITAAERRSLAEASVLRGKSALPEAAGTVVGTPSVDEATDRITVSVRLDASHLSIFRIHLLPMPDAIIERRAVVRPGGIA